MISLTAGATAFTLAYPFEFLKTKIILINEGLGIRQSKQHQGYNMVKIASDFVEKGYGSRSVYTGFVNSLTSRMMFLMGRNNMYKFLYDKAKPTKTSNDLTYAEKGTIAAFSSVIGVLISNGFTVNAVRQIGDLGRESKFFRPKESFLWFKGIFPNAIRVALINGVMMWPYNSMNEKLYVTFGDVSTNRIVAMMVAALWGTVISLPIDHIRTRLQYQSSIDKSVNRMNYRGMLDCIIKMSRNEGWKSYLAGFQACYIHMFFYTFATIYLCDIWIENIKKR